ncbi:MAG: HipA domain-containing protein [Candidatus Fermentibacteraceae bacterium]|nr:HipA domain-containing protein [Candidatus Fermentibacteraceae bacterium]
MDKERSMKACPGCGKPSPGWHPTCLRKLFGVPEIPDISGIFKNNVAELALESAGRLSISGAQPKLSVRVEGGSIVPAAKNGTHILKPPVPQWREMPQNENLIMSLAGAAGIEIPPHGLLTNGRGDTFYIVKRFDRAGSAHRVHVEDFCQAGGIPRDMKYRKSAEFCGKLIKTVTTFPKIEEQKFFKLVVFNFLAGNGDAHLKNYSFLYRRQRTVLAPAYDLVSSSLLIPGETQSAIPVNGKLTKLRLKDFKALGNNLKILPETVKKHISCLLKKLPEFKELIKAAEFSEEMKIALTQLIEERASTLGGEI